MRRAYDFYSTPRWCVTRLLESSIDLPTGKWLEPCVGSGPIVDTVNYHRDRIHWTINDIRDSASAGLRMSLHSDSMVDDVYNVDFLTQDIIQCDFDVAFTNPPYSQAEAFIRKSMEHAKHVVMLLRLNFLGSSRRASFLRENTPDIYVLPNRPSFTGHGTDATEYAWFHWGPNTAGRLNILHTTPLAERRDTERLA